MTIACWSESEAEKESRGPPGLREFNERGEFNAWRGVGGEG
jgi:hypothetical protein